MTSSSGDREFALTFTDGLLAWLRGRGKVLIVVHDNPDPDCLASALALQHLLMVKLNREPVVALSGMIGRAENLAMAQLLDISLTPLEIIDVAAFDVVCMLDTQPGTGNNSFPAHHPVDVVIDHHPPREGSRGCRWVDIREQYGATATILYEYLMAQGVVIGTKLATALFYAVKSETQDLGREAEPGDRAAYLQLFPLVNKRLLYEITHPKLPTEYFATLKTALEQTHLRGPVLCARLGQVVFPEIVAELADMFLRVEGADTAVCFGYYGADLIVSMRTTRLDINVGDIMRSVVAGKGAAGGHGMTGGGRVDGVRDGDGTDTLLEEEILGALGFGDEPLRRLIQ